MARMVAILALVLVAAAPRAVSPIAATRMLYLLGCDGTLARIDTVSGATTTTDLAAKVPIEHNATAGATFDGCLVGGAVVGRGGSVFHAVVADQMSNKPSGGKDYHIYRFTLPGLEPSRLGVASTDLDAVPRLVAAGPDAVRVDPASPRTRIDLTDFTGSDGGTAASVIEESSGRILVTFARASGAPLSLGVVDPERRSVVRLRSLPPTTASSVHLAPGGGTVYVEEATGPVDLPVKTGRIVLIEAATGTPKRTLTDPRIRTASFRALTPNGKAVYAAGDRLFMVALGAGFAAAPVIVAEPDSRPAAFFAPR